MTPITLYGYGYVGKAVAQFLGQHYALQVIDPQYPVLTPLVDTDLAIICVPTAQREDGSADTSIVRNIVKAGRHHHYLIKSTVPPGTTDALGPHCTFSPEYIGEGSYAVPWWDGAIHPTDINLHPFHIFGGARRETSLWVDIWQRVAGWVPKYRQTDATTAELVKYAENMYMATKKVFCSELYQSAHAFGVDYHELRDLWTLDPRIGDSMTLVWPDRLAYDGKCLPKDTRALVAALAAVGHNAGLFRAVIERNDQFQAPDADSDHG